MTLPNDPPAHFPHARYAALLDRTIETIRGLSSLKGGEYAGDADRLANFRRNGLALGLPMEAIWAVYYNKHHDAVMQWIADKVAGRDRQRAEPIEGRVHDMLTYLMLLLAMLEEGGGEAKGKTEAPASGTVNLPCFMEKGGLGRRVSSYIELARLTEEGWKLSSAQTLTLPVWVQNPTTGKEHIVQDATTLGAYISDGWLVLTGKA